MASDPDHRALNIVVVAYGSPDLLDRCLDALGEGLPVLVVDNSSSERVHDIAARHACRYSDSGSNVGFAAAVNRALVELGPDHGDVLLLNPDAQVTGEVARALQLELRAAGNERVACVSPTLTRDDGSPEQTEWPFPSPAWVWLEVLGLGASLPQTNFLIGAVLLLRSEALDALGPFDERFFLYAEETDWQRRAVNAGWSVSLCPNLRGRHTGAGTSTDSRTREAMFHASAERYIRKWYGKAGWQTFRLGVMAGAGIRSIVKGQRAPQRDRFTRYLRGPVRCAEAMDTPS